MKNNIAKFLLIGYLDYKKTGIMPSSKYTVKQLYSKMFTMEKLNVVSSSTFIYNYNKMSETNVLYYIDMNYNHLIQRYYVMYNVNILDYMEKNNIPIDYIALMREAPNYNLSYELICILLSKNIKIYYTRSIILNIIKYVNPN